MVSYLWLMNSTKMSTELLKRHCICVRVLFLCIEFIVKDRVTKTHSGDAFVCGFCNNPFSTLITCSVQLECCFGEGFGWSLF